MAHSNTDSAGDSPPSHTSALLTTETEPNIRKRGPARIDALTYLTAFLTPPWSQRDSAHLPEVVCYTIWLHLIAFNVDNTTPEFFRTSQRYPYFSHRIEPCLAEVELQLAKELGDSIYDLKTKDRIMSAAKMMNSEEALQYLSNDRVCRFYKHAIHNQKCFVEDLRGLSDVDYTGSNKNVRLLQLTCSILQSKKVLWKAGQKPAQVYGDYATLSEDRLVFLLDILRELRNAIGAAAESAALDQSLLSTLKKQLQIFDNDAIYSSACALVQWRFEREPYLVDPRSITWWIPITEGDGQGAPEHAVRAYPAGRNIRSTLTTIVPTVSLLSIVPAAMAFYNDHSPRGQSSDSNFWQAVSSSMLQLLSLITFVWPTLNDARLSKLTWVWIWILAGFSAICAAVSVPMYLVAPTIWSFVIAFAGSVGQAVVQLQVVTAI